jgi:hypothetical protein
LRRLAAFLLLACAAALALPARAEEAAPPLDVQNALHDVETLRELAKTSPACLNFTNACQICRRAGEGVLQCSTPAIACVPVDWTCEASPAPAP